MNQLNWEFATERSMSHDHLTHSKSMDFATFCCFLELPTANGAKRAVFDLQTGTVSFELVAREWNVILLSFQYHCWGKYASSLTCRVYVLWKE
jgi:hypothetical protein